MTKRSKITTTVTGKVIPVDFVASRRAYLKLHDAELDVLAAMPAWMFRLYAALAMMINFESGIGSTTYAALISAMTPMQPTRGPRHFVPDHQAVQRALLAFERTRLLKRDRATSAEGNRIFFAIAPRVGQYVQP